MNTSMLLILFGGDALTLALVTIYGFASHDTLGTAGMRVFITYLPLLISWLLFAPFLGCYDLVNLRSRRQLWRPFWAMVLAGPMAGILRGFWLGAPVIPLFVVIVGGVSALGLLMWRFIFGLVYNRSLNKHG